MEGRALWPPLEPHVALLHGHRDIERVGNRGAIDGTGARYGDSVTPCRSTRVTGTRAGATAAASDETCGQHRKDEQAEGQLHPAVLSRRNQ